MTIEEVITRLDAIATERYPMITDLDVEALRAAIKKLEPRWISVSERLPEIDGDYLVTEKSGRVCTYVFHKEGNSEEYWKRCAVAWMPLSHDCAEYKEPTTKNDLGVEEHKGEVMDFPNTFDEFADYYGFKDKEEVYTNGSELIQVYRVKQWLEHISTTMNDLGVDCIDRVELLKAMDTWDKFGNDANEGLIPLRTPALQDRYVPYVKYDDMVNCVKGMSPVTPQEPRKGHWDIKDNMWWVCSACGCQTRMMKKYNVPNFCPACGAKMAETEDA